MTPHDPELAASLDLPAGALRLSVTLLPRFARRLRALAYQRGRDPERVASRLLAEALVPDPGERLRLIALDTRGVQAALIEARHGK